nr:DEAD/DEAH box helicase family protein [Enterovibrio paralichthyis]
MRTWQRDCINQALHKFSHGQKRFLVQATPGAGKTFMAACLAKSLFDSKMIDFVVCISPSKAVAKGIKTTFSFTLNCPFNGNIGTLGLSVTYQSLRYLSDEFWNALSKHRVLCIFDEIHHCAGSTEFTANAWGSQILSRIQKASTFTLSLTGTPWRSDSLPLTLAEYKTEGHLACDFQYTLQKAINERVCRQPKIVLIDGDRIELEQSDQPTEYFDSLKSLISIGKVNYQKVLHHDKALDNILGLAVNRLGTIRQSNPNAGGLIVASSIPHANQIFRELTQVHKQTAIIVTYQDLEALSRIEQYRSSSDQWIVSVGMVSEGTDIPRLQVCCHLSNIKTELHFRQVLGRILRTTDAPNQEAWLYTFAEPSLTTFAEEIEQDIPDSCMYVSSASLGTVASAEEKIGMTEQLSKKSTYESDTQTLTWGAEFTDMTRETGEDSVQTTIQLNQFKQRVIEAFRYTHV